MTVSTEVDHNEYTGNGVTTSFPYTFRIFKKSDLVVQVVDLSENITDLVLDTDYTVTGAGGYTGGNVVLSSPLANGYQISISRELPVTQETDLRNQGKFFAEVHEDALDKLTMLIQQAISWLRLSLRKPSFVANYYDALNNYIRNLRDPSRPQDAATKNYVDSLANINLSRTLRTPEPIPELPGVELRKNKIVAMDNNGNPIMVLPESGSAADVLIELASSEDGKGDSLVAVKQPVSNSKVRTVHDWIADTITAKDGDSIVADGINNDAVGINAFLPVLASAQRELLLVPGIYLINDDLTIDIPVTFQPGAILKPRNGAQLTFNSEIRAGCYKIFDTEDDFYTSPVAVPSVKIAKGGVKPEWFGAATVSSCDDIASAVNCSPAFMKAWRATTGEYTANVTSSYRQSEYMHSYIELAAGKYRMDKDVFLGHTDFTPTTVRYNKNGGGVIGKGAGLSILVFTDSEYDGNAFFTANDMSGEMHTFKGFKCVAFDPTKSGAAQYETKVGAMILIGSADSITTSDLWAAGATTVVADTNGFGRGGVGIQFDSLVDHQFSDLLVEHCVHGVAFSSCISTGNNIKGFANKISDLSFGNYIPDWPQMVSQTTKNTIGVNGFESKFCLNNSIIFGTYDNMVDISGVVVDGRAESSLSVVTNRVIGFGVGGGVSGTISGSARNLLLGLIADFGVSFAGRDGAPLRLNFDVQNITGSTSSENAVVAIDKADSNLIGSIGIASSVFPILRSSSTTTTIEINASDITLTTGSPSGANAILCKGGNLNVTSLKISNSTGITGLVYADGGSVILSPQTISPVRTVTTVGGATVKSYSITDFA